MNNTSYTSGKENRTVKRIAILLFSVLLLTLSACARSENEGAEKYTNGKCTVFYPGENMTIRDYAMSLCESKEELLYDYKVEKAGDYLKLSYQNGRYFYLNKDMSDLEFKVIDGAEMLSDMLRYEMKKNEIIVVREQLREYIDLLEDREESL